MSTSFLRKATAQDAQNLFEWANDPTVRFYAFDQNKIEWSGHMQWFQRKLDSKECLILILEQGGSAKGQIRFDYVQGRWQIDYSIAPNQRGKGLGRLIVQKGLSFLADSLINEECYEVYGDVKTSNIASCKVFRSLGFSEKSVHSDVVHFKKKIIKNNREQSQK